MKSKLKIPILHKAALVLAFSVNTIPVAAQEISLAGTWEFVIDSNDLGIRGEWFNRKMEQTIRLPGTMNTNNLGMNVGIHTVWTASIYDSSFFFQPRLAKYRQPDDYRIPFWLTPLKYYCGPAWYRKEIIIPENWKEKRWKLYIERAHIGSMAWIDGYSLGPGENSLVAPHIYEIPESIGPGRHIICIRIDNRLQNAEVGPDSHSVSDHTQGNWNGMIGKICLQATDHFSITGLQVFPEPAKQGVRVTCQLKNASDKSVSSLLRFLIYDQSGKKIIEQKAELQVEAQSSTAQVQWLDLDKNLQLWDEFDPYLYTVKVMAGSSALSTRFGMREIVVSGKKVLLNGRPVFFRGDLNNCEFPLTGHPPMDTTSWLSLMRALKNSGINHIRFHSWCPPDAAFTAADILGIYLQPEAPTWPNHGISLGDGRFIDQYIYEETARMVEQYGNHPSFLMLAAGNEPAGKNQSAYLAGFVNYWKQKDNRRIYTGASVATSWPLVPENEYMVKSGARGLNWNSAAPNSTDDYNNTIEKYPVPFVQHEQGQWCAFPDLTEIKKYTGAYRAKNFELFRDDLKEQGMLAEAPNFLKASGKLQALCYKMEIERSLRTKDIAGFQLLGLQDFQGQGTALVGVLNAFYQEKGYISKKEFRQFCNSTVPLLKMKKFTWRNDETMEIEAAIFHYGKEEWKDMQLRWELLDNKGKLVLDSELLPMNIPVGTTTTVGRISILLNQFKIAGQFTLVLKIKGTEVTNKWNCWIYPATLPAVKGKEIYTTDTLDDRAAAILSNGGRVLLLLNGKVRKGKEVIQSFTPVFWNTSWFKMRPPHTLGLLMNERHPLWKEFPTSYHSDLQWWEIVNGAQVMHLEHLPKELKPLIRNIDTWFMNRRLAMLFEVKVNGGSLMVCSADITNQLNQRPVARQLEYSIRKYMGGDEFRPSLSVSIELIRELVTKDSEFVFDSFTKGNPDELKPIKQ